MARLPKLMMIDLLDKPAWRDQTSGERLLFLLLSHHQEWKLVAEALQVSGLSEGGRYGDFSNYIFGAGILHLQQRLIRLANDVRQDVSLDREDLLKEIRARTWAAKLLFPLAYGGDIPQLFEEVLQSCEQSKRDISKVLRKKVFREGPATCYSCGRDFGIVYDDAPNGLTATADHVWPRALGGDSIFENLLPACVSCNSTKGNLAAWQMAWAHHVVFSDVDQDQGLSAVPREVKIALHMRAATTYARNNNSSLRDAFLAIGPRETLQKVDKDQGYDFFNLRVHDETRTSVRWTPA